MPEDPPNTCSICYARCDVKEIDGRWVMTCPHCKDKKAKKNK